MSTRSIRLQRILDLLLNGAIAHHQSIIDMLNRHRKNMRFEEGDKAFFQGSLTELPSWVDGDRLSIARLLQNLSTAKEFDVELVRRNPFQVPGLPYEIMRYAMLVDAVATTLNIPIAGLDELLKGAEAKQGKSKSKIDWAAMDKIVKTRMSPYSSVAQLVRALRGGKTPEPWVNIHRSLSRLGVKMSYNTFRRNCGKWMKSPKSNRNAKMHAKRKPR